MSDNDIYLIWSNQHRGWWGPDRCGYSPGLRGAGRYSRQQAVKICRDSLPDAMYLGHMSEVLVREADLSEVITGGLVPAAVFGEKP
jgi:hypothetical protein